MQFTAPLASLLALAAFAQAGLVARQDASASDSASVSMPGAGGPSASGSATGSVSVGAPTGGAAGTGTRSTTSPHATSTGLETVPGDGAGLLGAPGLAALAGAAVVAVVFA